MTVEHHLTPTDLKQDPPAGLAGQALKQWKYQRYIKDYLRCIASVDENVGPRAGLPRRTRAWPTNTIVFYTSDQGFFLGDHGWFDKRFMYEESLRMPLLVRWPGRIKPGAVNDDLVLNLDFAETFLDLAGEPVPGDMQGRSLRPVARRQDAGRLAQVDLLPLLRVSRRSTWSTSTTACGPTGYKLIYFPELGEWELFDLEKDPHELKSVYDDPAYAETVKDLKAELERLRKQYGDDG